MDRSTLNTLLQAAMEEHANRPYDTFYTEDVCDLRYEPGHIGIIERTTSDVDSHNPHPHTEGPDLRCHNSISREAFRKFKHDGIPPVGTVLVEWQTKKYSELIPTTQLTLTDRSVVVGDVVKKDPKDAMSGTVKQTKMECAICPCAFKEFKLVNGNFEPPLEEAAPIQVSAEDIRLANDYRSGDLVIYQGWVGRIEETADEITMRLSNGSIVVPENPNDLEDLLDVAGTRFDVGAVVETSKANLRRGFWVKGSYISSIRPIGDVIGVRPLSFSVRWMWKFGNEQRSFDRSDEPPSTIGVGHFELKGGRIYDPSKSPRTATGMNRSHTPFMSGDKVRFRDPAGAAVKYPWFRRISTSETDGFDLNVFTILLTKTTAQIAWQDQTVEVLPGVAVVPDYNMEDDNEVWPGEIVITNEKIVQAEDWVFHPKQVGVVQSVSSEDRIAKVKWLPNAQIRYNQVGLDEHLEELSLLEGSTLGLDPRASNTYPVDEVTLYDIRTIGALSRRRGDFVVLKDPSIIPNIAIASNDFSWFGEVIDLNLDGTLMIRLGAAAEVRDVCISPENTTLVYSSDAPPSLMGDDVDDPYDTGDEFDEFDDMSDVTDDSEEGEWMVNGQVVEQDGDWDTESEEEEEDDDGDVEMAEAPAAVNPTISANTNGDAGQAPTEPIKDASNGDAGPNLSIPLQEPSVKLPDTEDAPPAFDVLEDSPPPNHPYLLPEPPPFTGARMKRIRRDHTILSTSLPQGIFVRTYESRLDLLRILIVGPLGTPYEYAPFVIDMRFPATYPQDPPDAYFHSWTNGQGPVNPNLYENGKICLSLLGTWHAGEKGEAWSPSRSTILQVLVSILGLVLVREPYYNEAGFEARAGSEDAKVPSQLYSERTYFRSRAFITYALRNGVEGFDTLLDWLYLDKKEGVPGLLEKAIEAAKELVAAGDTATDVRAGLGKMSRGAIIMLGRQVKDLEAVRGETEEKATAKAMAERLGMRGAAVIIE